MNFFEVDSTVSLRMGAFRAFLVCAMLLGAASCSTASADEQIVLTADDLPATASLDSRGLWQSVAVSGDAWSSYPGGVTLVVHHGLGRAPVSILPYVAFVADGGGGSLASGDLARIVQADETTVTLRNGTDADLFIRLVLE